MRTIQIEASSNHYPVRVGAGLRHQLGQWINKGDYSRVLLVADEAVVAYYSNDCMKALENIVPVHLYAVPSGEASKSFSEYEKILQKALAVGLDRKSCMIALGGGMIGDLAGFAAASYMRGVGFIQIPTTLLAHDSSVGGKVAINLEHEKNMVGAFYQPDGVYYDIETLQTLPEHEWRSGFAEVIKHGIIGDSSLYHDLRNAFPSLDAVRSDADLALTIERAIRVKAHVVAQDETETGVRAYLNFGHTLAHALESMTNFEMSHGDAVSIGMRFALRMSRKLTGTQVQEKDWREWFDGLGFPRLSPHLDVCDMLKKMKKDKKSTSGQINMVLLEEIGRVCLRSVDDEMIIEELKAFQREEQA
ncbi:3-dehydroquinate synthase [Bacillaceae bacterium SIJ1]|uniref:3-dehydroquinate synthase n=1 Tax=Litoribacterium kuwaitense TaxID=1398745 RepID=UPI0013EDD40B|nr:3-dehydroquinate synthase [Litoribacterium kuwaitense]NGP43708.1 3-dehydroquinate synthase [Litoribacterium kuwaitense]